MAAATPRALARAERSQERIDTTLLELVQAVAEHARDEHEVVATIRLLLRQGRVRLVGSFRGQDSL